MYVGDFLSFLFPLAEASIGQRALQGEISLLLLVSTHSVGAQSGGDYVDPTNNPDLPEGQRSQTHMPYSYLYSEPVNK